MQGEEVSNARPAGSSPPWRKPTSTWKTGALVTKKEDSYRDLLEAALKDLIESEKAQEGGLEPSAETPIKETGAADSVHEKKEEGKKALTQDQLTQYTGIDQGDASSGISYLWLVVKAGDEEIRVTRIVDVIIEADTPSCKPPGTLTGTTCMRSTWRSWPPSGHFHTAPGRYTPGRRIS